MNDYHAVAELEGGTIYGIGIFDTREGAVLLCEEDNQMNSIHNPVYFINDIQLDI